MTQRVTLVKKPKAIVLELTGCLATREFMSYSEHRKSSDLFCLEQNILLIIHNFMHNKGKHSVRKNIGLYFSEYYPRNKELRLDINFFKLQEANEQKEQTFNENCPKINDQSKKLPLPDVAINHILWRLDNDPGPSAALTLFLLHFNEWAYKKGLLITPVYQEVKTVLEFWKNLNIAVYVDVASANFVSPLNLTSIFIFI